MLRRSYSFVHNAALAAWEYNAKSPSINSARKANAASFPLARAHQFLAVSEFVAVISAGFISKVVYLDWMINNDLGWFPYLMIAVALGATLYITFNQMGLYDIETLVGPEINFGKIFCGLGISFLIVLGALYAIRQGESISRGWVGAWFVSTAFLLIPVRALIVTRIKRGIETGLLQRRIAIIGSKDYVVSLANRIRQAEGLSVAIDLFGLQKEANDARFVGELPELEATMPSKHYARVIIAIPAGDINVIQAVVRSLGAYTTELFLCSDFANLPISTTGSRKFGGVRADVIHLLPGSETRWFLKRALDVVLSFVLLVGALPFFLLIALAIKLDTRSPVLFRQRRFGQNGTVFHIYKFRTMTVAEDGPTVMQATLNDTRVTRVGRVLRATSIDELPQLLNVLLGHMSLVGPRPHAIAHDQAFEAQFDLFARRRRVKPGLTGWAQVNGFRGETRAPDDISRRMEHDLYYIDNWSVWLDLEILARTLFVFCKGAY